MFCDIDKNTLQQIATLHFNQWSKFNPQLNLQDKIVEFSNEYATTKDSVPCGFALFEENDLVGFCRLRLKNLNKYPEIFPWISSVLILDKYKGKGYGAILVNKAKDLIQSFGYPTAYVWTDQAPDFYKKLGFTFVQYVEKNDGGIAELYKYDF